MVLNTTFNLNHLQMQIETGISTLNTDVRMWKNFMRSPSNFHCMNVKVLFKMYLNSSFKCFPEKGMPVTITSVPAQKKKNWSGFKKRQKLGIVCGGISQNLVKTSHKSVKVLFCNLRSLKYSQRICWHICNLNKWV